MCPYLCLVRIQALVARPIQSLDCRGVKYCRDPHLVLLRNGSFEEILLTFAGSRCWWPPKCWLEFSKCHCCGIGADAHHSGCLLARFLGLEVEVQKHLRAPDILPLDTPEVSIVIGLYEYPC